MQTFAQIFRANGHFFGYNSDMLIEFRVENHRSIRDEQVLSMEAAVDKGEKEDLRPRTVKGYKKKLLPVACIYGANASGKTYQSRVVSGERILARTLFSQQLSV